MLIKLEDKRRSKEDVAGRTEETAVVCCGVSFFLIRKQTRSKR